MKKYLGFKFALIAAVLYISCPATTHSQEIKLAKGIAKNTYTFSRKDTLDLKMDIYDNGNIKEKKACIIFIFGGAFLTGSRDAKYYGEYFNKMAESNFKVVSIDYRLGLKNTAYPTAFNTSKLKSSIEMAVTDLYDATKYLLENADKLGIDTSKIILSGSSAGAITALQADWEKRNHTPLTYQLPENFQYAGVIAFAGAILSYKGKPEYNIPPAPTMMFHGTKDKIVVYNKIKLLNRGMFGSHYLAKYFKKHKYPYYFRYEQGMGHEVAGTPMHSNLDDILWFIDTYVDQKKPYLMEVDFNDMKAKKL